jgi:hypothetical protein
MPTKNAIRNCTVKFRKICPRAWESLSPTPDDFIRVCETCSREVFFCEGDAEAVDHAKAGHCIAKPMPDGSGRPVMYLGEPIVPPPMPTPQQRSVMEEYRREEAKTKGLRDVEYASRMCPRCGYPCADWLTVCRVCQFVIGRGARES